MEDFLTPKWRGYADKAAKWTKTAAKEAVEKAKAADKMVRDEIERHEASKLEAASRHQREQEQAAALKETEQAAAIEAARRQAVIDEPRVRAWYANRLNNLSFNWDEIYYGKEKTTTKPIRDVYSLYIGKLVVERSLSSMSASELDICLYAALMRDHVLIWQEQYYAIATAIAYNEGNCVVQVGNYSVHAPFAQHHGIKNQADAIHKAMQDRGFGKKQAAIELFLSLFSRVKGNFPNHPLVEEIEARVIGGASWAAGREHSLGLFTDQPSAGSLLIGASENGRKTYYSGEGSLVSIAPPGSGKTQCNVFPNLLSYDGPAIVLDVKGECFEKTGHWRANNVGPIYRFNPLEPQTSAKYNPLASIDNDPDTLWEDARLISELLIVPEDKNDPSWENRARDVVTGIIAWLVIHRAPEERKMGQIVDVLAKIGWTDFIEDAKHTFEIQPLSRLGNSLADMPDKQLEGVLDAARRHLSVWEGARVERVTSVSSWKPNVLRDGSKSTIYICIPPSQIEAYAPLLRVIFAQHLRVLMHKLPGRLSAPILFMLDELPRLGPMKPVEEALEVGRQYGIKLWMFAQSLGQFEKTYANAEGMLGSCAVRIYMNPSSHDGTAKRISEELGFREGLLDGTRQLMVEPQTLTGPEYKDWQIVFARDSKPRKLRKLFAYQEEPFKTRMNQAPQ